MKSNYYYPIFFTFIFIILSNSLLNAQTANNTWNPRVYTGISKDSKRDIFFDNFDNNKHKWPVSKRKSNWVKRINRGNLYLESQINDFFSFTKKIPIQQHKDFEIETSIKFVKGHNSVTNDLCWGKANYSDHKYHFGFTANGNYSGAIKQKRYVNFLQWTRSNVIFPYGYNKLTIRKVASHYYFFLNNNLVHVMPFEALFGNEIGFVVSGKSAIQVDYLRVSQIQKKVKPKRIMANKTRKTNLPNFKPSKKQKYTHRQKSTTQNQQTAQDNLEKRKKAIIPSTERAKEEMPPPQQEVVTYPTDAPPVIESSRRVALIIGNASYQNGRALRNPINDANSMANALQELGFQVTTHQNTDLKGLRSAVRDFGKQVNQGDVALFYYSGHGIQVQGRNHLIPVDAELVEPEDARWETIAVDDVLAEMEENQNNLNIVILDACRDNPFKSWQRGDGNRGFAIVPASSGTLVAFATSAGAVAADGKGENGVYTSELLKHLNKGERIEDVFMKTRLGVEQRTKGQQSPQEWSKLRGIFKF